MLVSDSLCNLYVLSDPNEDQFEKRKTAKKERVAKNELQRLRNIARAQTKKGNDVYEYKCFTVAYFLQMS